MSLFHIAIAGKIVTIMSVATGYTIERHLDNIDLPTQMDLTKIFNSASLERPLWTKAAVELGMDRPVRQYFMYERAEELREQESDYERVSAMSMFADAIPTMDYIYD